MSSPATYPKKVVQLTEIVPIPGRECPPGRGPWPISSTIRAKLLEVSKRKTDKLLVELKERVRDLAARPEDLDGFAAFSARVNTIKAEASRLTAEADEIDMLYRARACMPGATHGVGHTYLDGEAIQYVGSFPNDRNDGGEMTS